MSPVVASFALPGHALLACVRARLVLLCELTVWRRIRAGIVGDYSIVSAEDISIGAWLDHQCGIAPENATFADVHQENWPRIPAEKYISEASCLYIARAAQRALHV